MVRWRAVAQVYAELRRAEETYIPFQSPHEGISIIREEFEELWDEVKANKGHPGIDPKRREAMRKEAIHLAAMAVRFLVDLM